MKSKVFSIKPVESFHHNRDSFYEVIKTKTPTYAEIVVNLFDHCNMRCVFCPQDHTDTLGLSRAEILSKIDPIVAFVNANPSKEFAFHIMGGELFQDELIDAGFLDYYSEFIAELLNLCDETKDLQFNFVTNFVFSRTDEVRAFCTKHNLKLAVSYDPTGRFNKAQLAVFKDNIVSMKDQVRMIGCTMTKSSIRMMLDEGDPYFDYLYSNFACDWDYLLPGTELLHPMMPAESELLDFYKLLIDKYPLCINIHTFVSDPADGISNAMPCTRGNSFTIFSDNSVPKGCSGTVILKNKTTQNLGGVDIIEKFLDDRNCFQCEYYKRCTFSCFVHNDYKDMVRDVDGCVYKEAFKYADDKKDNK
jgi:hypothetical protein